MSKFKEKSMVQAYAGETVLKGEDFKRYVGLLREKSLSYKQKRADLSDLKAEYGVLERTLEVLKYVTILNGTFLQEAHRVSARWRP